MLNALCAQYNLAGSLNKNIKKKKKKKKLSKSDVLGLDVAQGRTSANLLWWPVAAQRSSIFVRGVPTMAEFMQYNTVMLGTSILINKCWENLIKIGFDHGIRKNKLQISKYSWHFYFSLKQAINN